MCGSTWWYWVVRVNAGLHELMWINLGLCGVGGVISSLFKCVIIRINTTISAISWQIDLDALWDYVMVMWLIYHFVFHVLSSITPKLQLLWVVNCSKILIQQLYTGWRSSYYQNTCLNWYHTTWPINIWVRLYDIGSVKDSVLFRINTWSEQAAGKNWSYLPKILPKI